MLRQMKDLQDLVIDATDGNIGDVKNLYFDDEAWVIRYLVVEAGSWLSSRKVLISPIAAGTADWSAKLLPVSLTREQVKNSPVIDSDKPVSRQQEMDYMGYYGYPYYWGGAGLWGEGASPGILMSGYSNLGVGPEVAEAYEQAEATAHHNDDPHLRSCKAVRGYHIHASDGDIGHLQGLIVDVETWAIRYIIVDTSNWWLGHQVLIPPQWIQEVSWADGKVSVNLTRQAVKDAPHYDAAAELDRKQESRIYEHYGRPGYWENGQ
ncbi:PRC-barrel domain-containing protein [Aeromonas salmonicida]|uniref:PRC-barrel domain-containing protein n=1 Tax=Aeromonas salmonicida TaxID=645 RepID=UPI00259D41CB|nr:PRC-barrel domain-containing protein [Aeromonas salmonicida]MDM5101428.1 PRC-barrel domain-containing protein [Aeromonas salmonicida]